jgi:hypothetical protein
MIITSKFWTQLHEQRDYFLARTRQEKRNGGNYQTLVERARDFNHRIVARLQEG